MYPGCTPWLPNPRLDADGRSNGQRPCDGWRRRGREGIIELGSRWRVRPRVNRRVVMRLLDEIPRLS